MIDAGDTLMTKNSQDPTLKSQQMNQITRGTTARSICQELQFQSITFLVQSFWQLPIMYRIKASSLSWPLLSPLPGPGFFFLDTFFSGPLHHQARLLTISQAGWVYFRSAFGLRALLHLSFYLWKMSVSGETKWNPYLSAKVQLRTPLFQGYRLFSHTVSSWLRHHPLPSQWSMLSFVSQTQGLD